MRLDHFDFTIDRFYVSAVYQHSPTREKIAALLDVAPADYATPRFLESAPQKAWKEIHNAARYKRDWLEQQEYPALVPRTPAQEPPPNPVDRKRKMQLIAFPSTWFEALISSLPHDALSLSELRFALMMLSHPFAYLRPKAGHHQMNLWPNYGPYNAFIRRIAQWAIAAGFEVTTTTAIQEQFAFSDKKLWRLTIEVDLEEPFYLKPIGEEEQ